MSEFTQTLLSYYQDFGRHDLPWRQPEPNGSFDPYKIMVSEIMLQQTQVARVIPKFNEFLLSFPTVHELSGAPLADVLRHWSGLGYNRRAKFLWQAAQMIQASDRGFPDTQQSLVALPGVGVNTAGAIMAYAYNQPALFVETNVRTVFIHHFFADQGGVTDKDILEILRKEIDGQDPREFYWALMDYGTHLKQTVGNLNKQSKSYTKQSTFAGSKRQVRGQVLRALAAGGLTTEELSLQISDARLSDVLQDLRAEAMIQEKDGQYYL